MLRKKIYAIFLLTILLTACAGASETIETENNIVAPIDDKYIWDLSDLYPDLAALASVSREAALMSDKSGFPQGLNDSSYGLQRGDASNKDWYAVSGIILTYEFFKDVVCPKW